MNIQWKKTKEEKYKAGYIGLNKLELL